MPMFEKILGVWAVSRTVSTTPVLMRLFVGITAITVCAILAAFLGALFLGAGVWFFYNTLLLHGVPPQDAMIVMLGLVVLLLLVVGVIMQYYWQQVRRASRRMLYLQSPVTARFATLMDAFMNGYNSKDAPTHPSK